MAFIKLGIPVLGGSLASLHVFLLLLVDTGLLGNLVTQALQLALQCLAVIPDIRNLTQGSVASGLGLKDGLLLLVASRRGLNQRRLN